MLTFNALHTVSKGWDQDTRDFVNNVEHVINEANLTIMDEIGWLHTPWNGNPQLSVATLEAMTDGLKQLVISKCEEYEVGIQMPNLTPLFKDRFITFTML